MSRLRSAADQLLRSLDGVNGVSIFDAAYTLRLEVDQERKEQRERTAASRKRRRAARQENIDGNRTDGTEAPVQPSDA